MAGLSGDLNLTFFNVDANGDYVFNWTLENTSTLAMHPDTEITAFGFNVDPDITGAIATGDFTTVSSGSASNGFTLEFCLTGGPNCAGGGSTGPNIGETWDGQFTLLFAGGDPGTVTLSQPLLRFQSTGLNGQGSAVGVPGNGPPVPEPGTWAMMLLGFAGAGIAIRRSRRPRGELLQLA